MRVSIVVDSATPEQIRNLTAAFQSTRDMGMPTQITDKPTVTVCGVGMGWGSPALDLRRASAVLDEFMLREEES